LVHRQSPEVTIPTVREVHHAWGVTVRRLLDEGIRTGEFAPALSVRECVEAILAIADGVLLTAASGTRELSARQIERRVEQLSRECRNDRPGAVLSLAEGVA
jgi:hypothetical protein